jgi:HEAT repeats
MDVGELSSSEPAVPLQAAPGADPRLQPTPDYGMLGPGSDISTRIADSRSDPIHQPRASRRFGPVLSIIIGIVAAISVANIVSAHPFGTLFTSPGSSSLKSVRDPRQIDRLKPQNQAESLLELAVGRSDGAVDQISSRVDRWQGKLQWTSQIATLTTAALNSNDRRVRESGIEVELAALGLSKNSASLDYVLRSAESKDHAKKIWGLWALGLIGNRGVETSRVVDVLKTHLTDRDEDSRHWAVEGLALTGATRSIGPLLQTMHDDPSSRVRESAACSLAESGMYTSEQRLSAVPQLLNYTDDPSLDAQTHAWAFQALSDITQQRLPKDPAAWRTWYASTKAD